MMRLLLGMLIVAVFSAAAAQTMLHEAGHAAGFQSDKSSQNSEAEKHTQRADLRLEHAAVPMYPQLARTARIFGTVQVQVTVKDGKVISTEVKSGHPMLAPATIENIQTWRFHPLVNATFTTKFTYQLETKKPLDPQNPKVELELPLLVKITAVPVTLDSQKGQSAKGADSTDIVDPAKNAMPNPGSTTSGRGITPTRSADGSRRTGPPRLRPCRMRIYQTPRASTCIAMFATIHCSETILTGTVVL